MSDAVSKGAEIVCGGKRGPQSTLFEPTLITGIKGNMEIAHMEIFGPVAPIVRYAALLEIFGVINGYILYDDIGKEMRSQVIWWTSLDN